VKKLILIFFSTFVCVGFSQNYPQYKKRDLVLPVHYKNYYYAYFDVVREAGLGCEMKIKGNLAFDFRLAYLYPHSFVGGLIKSNDLFYSQGFSFSFAPKWYFVQGKKLYLGLNLTYAASSYKKQWVAPKAGYDPDWGNGPENQLRDKKMSQVVFGPSFGTQFIYKKIYLEPFAIVGIALYNKYTVTTYTLINDATTPKQDYQGMARPDYNGFMMTLGIKIGFCNSKNNDPRYRSTADSYNNDMDGLDKEVGELYKNFQISEEAITEYEKRKKENRNEIYKMHGVFADDTTAIDTTIALRKSRIKTYLEDHTFLKGAYCDTIIKKNAPVYKRKTKDIFDNRRRTKYTELYEKFRVREEEVPAGTVEMKQE
jgi:hypothetical protein